MSEKPDSTIKANIEDALGSEPVYRGIHGKKRLVDLLPAGIGLKDILPRIVHLVAGPYRERVEEMEAKSKTSAAEKRALSRKAGQTPDIIVHGDLSLAEIQHMLELRSDGLTPGKIAGLFDVPAATVKHVFDTMDGKHSDRVIFSSEMRRRRTTTLTRPRVSGKRALDTESMVDDVAQSEKASSG